MSQGSAQRMRVISPEASTSDKISIPVGSKTYNVKGSLKRHFLFWENMGASKFIVDVIKFGYKIPFITTPTAIKLKNNRSALNNKDFVSHEIASLVDLGCVIELSNPPEVVNPLTVADNGKKRLVLDLRHVNKHIFKFAVKYEGLEQLSSFMTSNCFAINFDLKSGYHHVDIFPEHQKYLGFAWHDGTKIRYFKFTVMPFGLSSACGLFTKLLKPLVKRWRNQSKSCVVYLDDGICIAKSEEVLRQQSREIRMDLSNSGFIINESKSLFSPQSKLQWLGFLIDFQNAKIYIPENKILDIVQRLRTCLMSEVINLSYLATIVGKLIAIEPAVGSVAQLMTRAMQRQIADNNENYFINISLSKQSLGEVKFWIENLTKLHGKTVLDVKHDVIVYSDASATGGAGYINDRKDEVCKFSWTKTEEETSSTHRELLAIFYTIQSLETELKGKKAAWLSDSANACRILKYGSMNQSTNTIALQIYSLCVKLNVTIFPSWIPRSENEWADFHSKSVDTDAWEVSEKIFAYFDHLWGRHTYDRFANSENKKCRTREQSHMESGNGQNMR